MQKTITKRSYHPLVPFLFHTNSLSENQLKAIPKTTRDYWKQTKLCELHGQEWVSHLSDSFEDFEKIQKRKIIFKSARLCVKIFSTVETLYSNIKVRKRIWKKHTPLIIETIDYLAKEMKLSKACRVFNITTHKYYRDKNKLFCTASILNLCFKTHPHQLTIAETSAISQAINHPDSFNKTISTIWYGMLRKGDFFCGRSTFYKYTKLLSPLVKKVDYFLPSKTFSASRILEYIHIDTTFLPTMNDGYLRVVILKDNYSKFLLHFGIVESGHSKWIADLLKVAFNKYHLSNYKDKINIVSDGGSENKGDVIEWINKMDNTHIRKLTAKTSTFDFTNNEIESTFHILKNKFLKGVKIKDKDQLKILLEKFQHYNNNERYPGKLYGLTPHEVFNGEVINKYRFKESIKASAKMRHIKNRNGRFCDICY
jgi:hypothetical protein